MTFNSAVSALYKKKSVFRRGWRAGDYLVQQEYNGNADIIVLVSPKGQYTEPWQQKQEDAQAEDWEILT